MTCTAVELPGLDVHNREGGSHEHTASHHRHPSGYEITYDLQGNLVERTNAPQICPTKSPHETQKSMCNVGYLLAALSGELVWSSDKLHSSLDAQAILPRLGYTCGLTAGWGWDTNLALQKCDQPKL
eukprot:1380091-Amphidinium_carterae.1